jgi:hypothetical protein
MTANSRTPMPPVASRTLSAPTNSLAPVLAGAARDLHGANVALDALVDYSADLASDGTAVREVLSSALTLVHEQAGIIRQLNARIIRQQEFIREHLEEPASRLRQGAA